MTAPTRPRGIIHLDLDAFYASVEQLRRPELRGRPVIVGGGAGPDGRVQLARGVVSAASYEVRRYGVHSAMPLATALRLCPHAVVVPVDFTAYREKSAQIFAIARSVTPLVEPLSLDEAYLDVTGSRLRLGEPAQVAARLRDEILSGTGLHASFGVATTKVVAKVASDLEKPQGFVVVAPGDEAAFLAPLAVRTLPGLGPATEATLRSLGVSSLGQLAALPLETLQRRCGRAAGEALWHRAQGRDTSEVSPPGRPKSVSREETFVHDIAERSELVERIRELAADVGRRLRAGGWSARTVNLKLRSSDFSTQGRQSTLPAPTDADRVLAEAATRLLDTCWDGGAVRLVGVGSSGLEEAGQLDLLDPAGRRETSLDHTLDRLRSRFGEAAVRRGAGRGLRDLDYRGDDLRSLANAHPHRAPEPAGDGAGQDLQEDVQRGQVVHEVPEEVP